MVLQSLRASNTEGTSLSNFQLLLGMSKYLAALKPTHLLFQFHTFFFL